MKFLIANLLKRTRWLPTV